MPYINLKTNVEIENKNKTILKNEFGNLISLFPGKSESWLMVELQDKESLYFQGINTPCALIEVKVYGSLPEDKLLETFTNKATIIITKVLDIPSERIYVKYESVEHWGWNGSNF